MGSGESGDTHRKKLEIASNEKIAEQNLAFQKEKLEYDKQLQQQIFNREDSAYQRTVRDMRSAGVSPLAMQGIDAAGGAVQTEAPQNGMVYDYTSGMSTDMEKVNALLSAVGAISNVAQSVQQVQAQALQNEYARRTLDDRINQQYSNAVSNAYDSASKAEKFFYNSRYGINDSMTPEERYWAIYSRALGVSDDYSTRDYTHGDTTYYQKGVRRLDPAYDRGFSALRFLDYGLDKVMDFIPKLPRMTGKKYKKQDLDWLPF